MLTLIEDVVVEVMDSDTQIYWVLSFRRVHVLEALVEKITCLDEHYAHITGAGPFKALFPHKVRRRCNLIVHVVLLVVSNDSTMENFMIALGSRMLFNVLISRDDVIHLYGYRNLAHEKSDGIAYRGGRYEFHG